MEVITWQTTLLRIGLQYNNETCGGLSRGSSKTHHNINCKLIFCDWYTWEKVRKTGNEYGYGIRKKIAELSTGTGTDTDYFQKMKYGKSTGTDSFWNPRSEVGTDSELFLETRYGYGYGYYYFFFFKYGYGIRTRTRRSGYGSNSFREEKIKTPQRLDPWEIKFVSEHTAPGILLVSENTGPNLSKFLNP